VGGSQESLISILEWHRSGGKEGKAHLNDMAVFALGNTVLQMCVGVEHMVDNTNNLKERMKAFILIAPIFLHGYNLTTKLTLYTALEFFKKLKNFGFMMNKIKPSKVAISINETHVILFVVKRINGRTPHI
jgi:hypothetical protein